MHLYPNETLICMNKQEAILPIKSAEKIGRFQPCIFFTWWHLPKINGDLESSLTGEGKFAHSYLSPFEGWRQCLENRLLQFVRAAVTSITFSTAQNVNFTMLIDVQQQTRRFFHTQGRDVHVGYAQNGFQCQLGIMTSLCCLKKRIELNCFLDVREGVDYIIPSHTYLWLSCYLLNHIRGQILWWSHKKFRVKSDLRNANQFEVFLNAAA